MMRVRFVALPTMDAEAAYIMVIDGVREGAQHPERLQQQAVQLVSTLKGCAGAIVFFDRVELEDDGADAS